MIGDLERLAWRGCRVYVVFDSDSISTSSGLLHLPTFCEGGDYEIAPTPGFFTHNAIRIRYSHDCPMRPPA